MKQNQNIVFEWSFPLNAWEQFGVIKYPDVF
jgi:hypothetical protein